MSPLYSSGHRRAAIAVLAGLLLALAALPVQAGATTRWRKYIFAGRVNDVVGPRSDGHLVISAAGKLWLVGRGRERMPLRPRKRHRPRYAVPNPGVEPYLAHVPSPRCGFKKDELYAVTGPAPGLLRVTPGGAAYPYLAFPSGFIPKGIVLDTAGLFGGRLLVIGRVPHFTQLYAICNGQMSLIGQVSQRIEGGLAIAPPSTGVYAGQLLGADEVSGAVYAIDPAGNMQTVVTPPANPGGDIGVESLGVVPSGMTSHGAAFLSDRMTPDNIQTGSGRLMHIGWPQLRAAGAQEGDLLVATEGGANTFVVRCAVGSCTATLVAAGLARAHSEGQITFARGRLKPLQRRPPKPHARHRRARHA